MCQNSDIFSLTALCSINLLNDRFNFVRQIFEVPFKTIGNVNSTESAFCTSVNCLLRTVISSFFVNSLKRNVSGIRQKICLFWLSLNRKCRVFKTRINSIPAKFLKLDFLLFFFLFCFTSVGVETGHPKQVQKVNKMLRFQRFPRAQEKRKIHISSSFRRVAPPLFCMTRVEH